jgi:hypothetical protein
VAAPSNGSAVTIEQPEAVIRNSASDIRAPHIAASTGPSTPLEPHSDFTRRLLGKVLRSDAEDVARTRADVRFAELEHMTTPRETTPSADDEIWELAEEQTRLGGNFTTVASLLGAERNSTPPLSTMWVGSVVADDTFMSHCISVYFSSVYTEYQLIIVAALLSFKFDDRAAVVKTLPEKEVLEGYSKTCRVALETALSRLPLHMPAALETVQALSLGVSHPPP